MQQHQPRRPVDTKPSFRCDGLNVIRNVSESMREEVAYRDALDHQGKVKWNSRFLAYVEDGAIFFWISLFLRTLTALGESLQLPACYTLGTLLRGDEKAIRSGFIYRSSPRQLS